MTHFPRTRAAWLGLAVALAPAMSPAAPAASAPGGNAPLHDTRWVVQTVDGAPLSHTGTRGTPQLTLHRSTQHLSGFAGCNRIRGRYTQSGPQLALTAVASTRMACTPALMQQEQHLLAALAQVDGYRIEGRRLSLLQGDVVKITFSKASGS
ncbi:MAG: META domain-containing protein [Rhizobacter sp.]|nr:META domain-containing protein [Rhizobacter sp.]